MRCSADVFQQVCWRGAPAQVRERAWPVLAPRGGGGVKAAGVQISTAGRCSALIHPQRDLRVLPAAALSSCTDEFNQPGTAERSWRFQRFRQVLVMAAGRTGPAADPNFINKKRKDKETEAAQSD